MTQPSTLSLEMRLKVSSGSSQALHPYGVAGTWDQSPSPVEMWEWLVTDNLGVASHRHSASGQDLGRNVIQGDTENSKPIEGQGNFLLWKWEGGEEIRFRAVEQKTSCLSWMSREQPGKFLAILGWPCGAAGKAPDLKRIKFPFFHCVSKLSPLQNGESNEENCKVLDKRKKWFNIVGKGPFTQKLMGRAPTLNRNPFTTLGSKEMSLLPFYLN